MVFLSVLTSERNLNVVVYGITENVPKTPKAARFQNDLEKLLPIFSHIDCSIQATSIRDMHRLGKFKMEQTRPRPILVKFLRNIDVNNILSNRNLIPSPVLVKPDMTKDKRDIESKLLSQRWNLIQDGADRKSIRIRRNQLFINNQLYGQIINSEFVKSSHEGQATNSSDKPNVSAQMDHESGTGEPNPPAPMPTDRGSDTGESNSSVPGQMEHDGFNK